MRAASSRKARTRNCCAAAACMPSWHVCSSRHRKPWSIFRFAGVADMPLVTITVRKPKSAQFKDSVLDAVHAALVSSGVPLADKFQRVLELEAQDFRFDATYPDLTRARD